MGLCELNKGSYDSFMSSINLAEVRNKQRPIIMMFMGGNTCWVLLIIPRLLVSIISTTQPLTCPSTCPFSDPTLFITFTENGSNAGYRDKPIFLWISLKAKLYMEFNLFLLSNTPNSMKHLRNHTHKQNSLDTWFWRLHCCYTDRPRNDPNVIRPDIMLVFGSKY